MRQQAALVDGIKSSAAEKMDGLSAKDGVAPEPAGADLWRTGLPLDSIAEGVAQLDGECRYTAANHAYAEMLGCEPSDLVGKFWHDSPAPWTAQEAERASRTCAIEGRARFVVRLTDKDSSHRYGEVLLCPSVDGSAGGHYCLIEDITQHKLQERRMIDVMLDRQRRIGHELQQGLLQQLAGIRMMAQGLSHQCHSRRDRELAEAAAQFEQLIVDAQAQAKTIMKCLRPVEVEPRGLMSALHELASSSEKEYGVPCVFRCEQEVPVEDATVATQLYYIARDAILDWAVAPQAGPVSIDLCRRDGRLVLSLSDLGPNSAGRNAGPFSISAPIMQYRAAMIGASLEFASADDGGMAVVCRL